MKKLYMFLLLLLPLSFVSANAQDPIEKTAELIQSGNITELVKTFAPDVEVNIMGNEDSYPAAKAGEILSNFFKQNQPRSAKVLHRITSNANYRFAVIIVVTNNGSFRVSVNLKNTNGHFELNDIHIESEK